MVVLIMEFLIHHQQSGPIIGTATFPNEAGVLPRRGKLRAHGIEEKKMVETARFCRCNWWLDRRLEL